MGIFKNPMAKLTGGKGFRQEKKLTKKQIKEREEGQAFIDDYLAICDKHKRKLDIVWNFSKYKGPEAVLGIVDHTPRQPQIKDSFADAKQENFDLRDKCEHDLNQEAKDGEKGAMAFCTKCRLPKRDWGEGDKGFNKEARESHKRSIDREREKENAVK